MTLFAFLRALFFSVGFCLWGAMSLGAETAQPLDASAERARIAQQRSEQEAIFALAEVACYRRFAVSDCLRDARKSRRIALDELRRQEIVLNDEERRLKASQAVQRIQNNISQQAPAGAVQ